MARQSKEYGELFNKIYTAKGYDQIHFDLDDCESEEEADALRAESKRLINIVCEEVESMIHHRKSKWQAKADAIMHDWEVDEDINCIEKKANLFRGSNVVYSAELLFISECDLIDLLHRKGYKVTRKDE